MKNEDVGYFFLSIKGESSTESPLDGDITTGAMN